MLAGALRRDFLVARGAWASANLFVPAAIAGQAKLGAVWPSPAAGRVLVKSLFSINWAFHV